MEKCTICHNLVSEMYDDEGEELGPPVVFTYCEKCPCVYHSICLEKYLKYQSVCPVCRIYRRITRKQQAIASGKERMMQNAKRFVAEESRPSRQEPSPGELAECVVDGAFLKRRRKTDNHQASLDLARTLQALENADSSEIVLDPVVIQRVKAEEEAASEARFRLVEAQIHNDKLFAQALAEKDRAQQLEAEKKRLEEDRRYALELLKQERPEKKNNFKRPELPTAAKSNNQNQEAPPPKKKARCMHQSTIPLG